MKLKGPMAKIFGFSDKDHSKGKAEEISAPYDPDVMPKAPAYGIDVPFEQQTHVNLCGDASLNMLFTFKKKPTARVDLKKNPRGALEGINTDDVKARIDAVDGLVAKQLKPKAAKAWTALELAQQLYAHGPLICKGSQHFILLIAVNGDNCYFHDPWRGQYVAKSIKDFNKFLDWTDVDNVIGAGPARK